MSATRSRTTRRQAAPEPTPASAGVAPGYTIKPAPAPEPVVPPTDEMRFAHQQAADLVERMRSTALRAETLTALVLGDTIEVDAQPAKPSNTAALPLLIHAIGDASDNLARIERMLERLSQGLAP